MDWKYTVINKGNADIAGAADIAAIAAALPRLSDDELTAASNKGIFKRACKDIEGMGNVDITVSPDASGVIISFPDCNVTSGNSLAGFTCSCPAKTVCRHIIAAALVIRKFAEDNMGNAAADIPVDENISPEMPDTADDLPDNSGRQNIPECDDNSEDSSYMNAVLETVSGILRKGLVNCGSSEQQGLMSLSLKGSSNCRRIALLCRSAASDIEAMNSRSPAFNPLTASLRLGRIVNTVRAAAGESGKLLLRGGDYTDRGNGGFICLGAYPYRTSSGFAGITAILYETHLGEFFTFGSGLSDIYENTADAASKEAFRKQLRRHCHWQNDVSFEMLSGTSFRLINFKADGKNRISSSKQTVYTAGERLCPELLPEEIKRLPKIPEYDYFSVTSGEVYCAYPVTKVTDTEFDTVGQTLYFTLVSPENETVQCSIIHSSVNERAEKAIEEMTGKDLTGGCMTLRISRKGITPVSFMLGGKMHNFFFDLK